MKVIKVVKEKRGKLVSGFAAGKWQKEYAEGVETKPDIGYLFAYSSRNLKGAQRNFPCGYSCSYQFWLAEAEVVGRVDHDGIGMLNNKWQKFWDNFKLKKARTKYLLCSSITLIRQLN